MIEQIEAQTLAMEIVEKIKPNEELAGFSLGSETDDLIITVTENRLDNEILQTILHQKIDYDRLKTVNVIKRFQNTEHTHDTFHIFTVELIKALKGKIDDDLFEDWRFERDSCNTVYSAGHAHTIQINLFYVR